VDNSGNAPIKVTSAAIVVALVLVGVATGIYAASRGRPVTAANVNDIAVGPPQVDLAA